MTSKTTLGDGLKKKTIKKTLALRSFLDDLLAFSFFQPNPAYDNTPAIDLKLDSGKSNLIVMTGENASGKSFIRRCIQALAKRENIEAIHISAEGRANGGFERAFIYGSEADESTGWISCRTILKGYSTCQSRKHPHLIIYDEPDLGLSEGYSLGVGIKLQEFAKQLPEQTLALFVISHSRSLISQLLCCHPHHLRVGGSPDLHTWLTTETIPLDITKLADIQRERFLRINELLRS